MLFRSVVLLSKYAMEIVTKSNSVTTLFCVFTGVIAYAIMLIITGGINSDDMEYFPGGNKIRSTMIKLKIWKA